MAAPTPQPIYIDYTNVQPLVGIDKILVSDLASNAIPVATANQLVADGEAFALEDLSPYYVTVPALITTTGGDWTTLPQFTYNILFNMFVYNAALQLVGNFIARNTDTMGTTLSDFQNFYQKEYNRFLSRVTDTLPNGAYRYQLLGLQPTCQGIPRKPRRYSYSGNLGVGNYTDHQTIDPSQNYDIFWGNTFGNTRRGNGW